MGYILKVHREFYKRLDPLSFYTDTKFVQRYRLSHGVTRLLVQNYVATLNNPVVRGKHGVPHRIRFCIALRYFATGASYLAIADCHGVSKATVCRAVIEVSDYFHQHLSEYVEWPKTEEDKTRKALKFLKVHKKPSCFGLIDGTHVALACPRGLTADENQFYCYKGYYSINTMIVCDCDQLIIHVNASNPGSSNDIYCLNGSQIKHLGDRANFKGYFLLGDSGYVLTDYLLTPVKYEATDADVRYNTWHKSTRSKVERTIGILKQRWRCLDSSGGYLYHDPQRAGRIIEACAALHNCAKVGRVKLLRDFPEEDGFRRKQHPIVQPDQPGRKDRVVFQNIREEYIRTWFSK